MNTLEIYRTGRALPVVIDIDERCIFTKKLMGEHRITSEFTNSAVLDVAIGDYITYPASGGAATGENYNINQLPNVVKLNDSTYKYNVAFEANIYNLNKKIFKDGVSGLSDFAYNNNPQGFVDKILSNINEINPTWTGTAATGIAKTLQFTNESCGAALSKVIDTYKMEYDIINKNISLLSSIGSDSGYTFKYGQASGLYKLEREQVSNQKIITRCYGFGGTTNIPFDYRSGAKRLVFEASGMRYLESAAATGLYGVIEDVYTDDLIFPQRTSALTDVNMAFNAGSSSAVARVDKIVKNNTPGNCLVSCNGFSYTMVWGTNALTTITNFVNIWKYSFGAVNVTISSIIGTSINFTAQIPGVDFIGETTITAGKGTASNLIPNDEGSPGTEFNIKDSYLEDTDIDFDINQYKIKEQTWTIVFKSGDMDGVECEIDKFDYATKRIYIKAYTDADGYTQPNATIHPNVGDTYTLVNIKMPQSYIDTAEAELLTATQAYLDLNCVPHVIYSLDLDPKDAKLNNISLKAGDRVTIIDSALSIDSLIRINSIEYPLVNPYKIKAVITDYVLYSLQKKLLKSTAMFSTGSPQSGSAPGANNAGSTYFLNAMGTYSVPSTVAAVVVEPRKIYFTLDPLPTISNYQTTLAPIYGQDPDVKCTIVIDENNRFQRQQDPYFTYVDGLIDTISFDLGDTLSGYITISKP